MPGRVLRCDGSRRSRLGPRRRGTGTDTPGSSRHLVKYYGACRRISRPDRTKFQSVNVFFPFRYARTNIVINYKTVFRTRFPVYHSQMPKIMAFNSLLHLLHSFCWFNVPRSFVIVFYILSSTAKSVYTFSFVLLLSLTFKIKMLSAMATTATIG